MRVGTMAGVNHCLQLVLLVSWLILHGATPTQSHYHGGHASDDQGDGWLKYDGRMYKPVEDKKNWTEAWDDCKRNESYLVIINTENENHFIKNNSKSNKYWIGLQFNPGASAKERKDNFWCWQKNEGFADWGGFTGDCVEITKSGWNDNYCTEKFGYWCESETGTKRDDWIGYNNHTYQVFNKTKSWNDAWDDCKKRESYLVIIDTEDENEFIKNGSPSDTRYWIGLHANPGASGHHEAKFWWWHKHVGFTDWIGGQPDDSSKIEDCVEISINGWNDNNCSKTLGYWCERETGDQGDWLKHNGKMYKVVDDKKNWTDAWDDCKRNESHLVIIYSKDENEFIKNNSLKGERYWIGLQVNPGAAETNHSEKFWCWQKNEGFTDWGGGGDCVEITKFGWNDNTCSETSGYWCESETGNKSDAWVGYNNHKYQVFNETKSWHDAWDDCKKQESYLVIIDTQDENEFIKNRSTSYKRYWIGLHANPGVSGQHKDKFGWWHNHEGFFEDWAPGNPDNSGGAEDCVEISNGKWNDNKCNKTYGYWCEKETVSVCDWLPTLDGALQCLPIGYGDKAECQAIPGCCFIEPENEKFSSICVKPASGD